MAAPTLVSYTENVWSSTNGTGTKTSAAVTWLTGDLIVVQALSEGKTGDTFSTVPTATGLTFTLLQSHAASSNCACGSWSATATSGDTRAITIVLAGSLATSSHFGFAIWVFRNHAGVGHSFVTTTPNSTPTRALSLTGTAGSNVQWITGDWGSAAVPGTNTPTPTHDRRAQNDAGHFDIYVADLDTTVTSQNYGTAGSGVGPFTIQIVEVKGLATNSYDPTQQIPPGLFISPGNPGFVPQTDPGVLTSSAFAITGATGAQSYTATAGQVDVTILTATAAQSYTSAAGDVAVTVPGQTGAQAYAATVGTVSVTVNGVAGNLALSATGGTLSIGSNVTVTGATGAQTYAATGGTVSVSVLGATGAQSFAARSGGTIDVSVPGATGAMTLIAPGFGAVTTGNSFSITGSSGALALAAGVGTVSISIPGSTGALALAAGAGSVSTAANFTIAGSTGAQTYAATGGVVAVSVSGSTGALTLAAGAGSLSIGGPTTVTGSTGNQSYAAGAGSVSITIIGTAGALTLTAGSGSVNNGAASGLIGVSHATTKSAGTSPSSKSGVTSPTEKQGL